MTEKKKMQNQYTIILNISVHVTMQVIMWLMRNTNEHNVLIMLLVCGAACDYTLLL